MTPEMKTVQIQADDLGIPSDIRKGFFFVLGFRLAVSTSEEELELNGHNLWSLSDHLPQGGPDFGKRYDGEAIRKLYRETDFEPPTKKAWLEGQAHFLRSLSDFIDEDFEGALGAGLDFMIQWGTQNRAEAESYVFDCVKFCGHLHWLRLTIQGKSEDSLLIPDVVARAAYGFTDLREVPIFPSLIEVLSRLTNVAYVEDPKALWEGSRDEFLLKALKESITLVAQEGAHKFAALGKWSLVHAKPNRSVAEAINDIRTSVEAAFGFGADEPEESLYFGEKADRRILDLFAALAQAAAVPMWCPAIALSARKEVFPEQTKILRVAQIRMDLMGIPFDVQKGIAFITTLSWMIGEEGNPLSARLAEVTHYFPSVPEWRGQMIYDGVITDLLAELAFRCDPDFDPVHIQTPSGASFPIFEKPETDRFPEIGSEDEKPDVNLRVGPEFFRQLGAAIDEDLEGAMLAAYWFASGNHMDVRSLNQMAHIAESLRPPHLYYFAYLIGADPDSAIKSFPAEGSIIPFCTGTDVLSKVYLEVAYRCQFTKSQRGRGEDWNKNLRDFATHVASLAEEAVLKFGPFTAEQLAETRAWLTSPVRRSLSKTVEDVESDLREHQGFGYDYDESNFYPAQRYDLRAYIIAATVRRVALLSLES